MEVPLQRVTHDRASARPRADTLRWCSSDAPSTDLRACDEQMEALGAQRVRTLVQLRRPLPLEDADRSGIPGVTTRPFDPDRDAEGLLAVNNAAFDWHPEQGAWDLQRLRDALAQEWVDPSGILVHESGEPVAEGASLDAFCWTRVHPAGDPPAVASTEEALGEIWVIATHPSVHGSRLGPAMVVAGLDHLASVGCRTANLFTEADNRAALAMYDRLGFVPYECRGGYR